jgi:hypothetical protein
MTERRIEANFQQGWGVALLIVALAVGAFAAAGYIKQRTYHSPNDVLAPSGATHAAPAGEAKAAH